eukprot:1139236-Pelagomonas_calceolata.AAC.2
MILRKRGPQHAIQAALLQAAKHPMQHGCLKKIITPQNRGSSACHPGFPPASSQASYAVS